MPKDEVLQIGIPSQLEREAALLFRLCRNTGP